MKDIQGAMNALFGAMREGRSNYHLTLGEAISKLSLVPAETPVAFDYDHAMSPDPAGIGSYRGYYADLAIGGSNKTCTASEIAGSLSDALGKEFTGYKGGEFLMQEDTPLWKAEYGITGRAITGLIVEDDRVTLVTKEVD